MGCVKSSPLGVINVTSLFAGQTPDVENYQSPGVFNQPIPTVQKYKRDCNDARDCAMLIAKKHYGYRLKEISDQVDIKCYQTVSSACFRFESKISQKQTLLDNYTVVLQLLNRSAKKPNE